MFCSSCTPPCPLTHTPIHYSPLIHFRYLLAVTTRARVVLRIAVPETAGPFPTGRPAVNVTLFPTATDGADQATTPAQVDQITLDPRCKPTSSLALASSNKGVYIVSDSGAATEAVEVDPGEYVALVSAFSPQEADFVLTVYSAPACGKVRRLP